MKTKFVKLALVAFVGLAVVSCKKKAEEAKTSEAKEAAATSNTAVKYTADANASTIEWKGFKPTGEHAGTVKISNGVFEVKDGAVTSGTFLIDMKSIAVTDIPADDEMNGKLAGHLSSADFFNVENFPSAAFTVTGTEGGKLSGNLKLKEKENNVTFPATVKVEGDKATLTSEAFTIDRSKWDVKYGSKSFFDDLGDKFINDDIELTLKVVGKKK